MPDKYLIIFSHLLVKKLLFDNAQNLMPSDYLNNDKVKWDNRSVQISDVCFPLTYTAKTHFMPKNDTLLSKE